MAEARQRQDREAALGAANQAASLATRQPTHGDNPLHVGLSRVESAASTETCMYEYLFVLHGWITREDEIRGAWPGWRGWRGLGARGCGPGSRASLLKNFRSLETRHVGFVHVCMYIQVHIEVCEVGPATMYKGISASQHDMSGSGLDMFAGPLRETRLGWTRSRWLGINVW